MSSDNMVSRTDSMTARTTPFGSNAIVSAVASIRAFDADLTPRQRQMCEADQRRVERLRATGLYGLDPRRF
ncbi:MAG TPA: hypothetical protein VL294_12160 [Pseudolysinimonas sp.]|jgi:hypothetical protein|nr:hypothetical protein [Pseudolysinimonas sp.]